MEKKLTLLHSNDLHGDFLAEQVDRRLIGGAAMLSGYIRQVRRQEENVLYLIAGDMFKGSIIDSEYRGFSTIEIMNALAPDAVTVGNHEIDYGIAHLLFLEKCARFPIINANLFIKTNHARLFQPCILLDVHGIKVLVIGILTDEILEQTRCEDLIGSFIDVEAAAREVQIILDSYRTTDVDLTVLLTHIGFDRDQQLAALIDPAWGVDCIIGGHTHTLLQEPCVVNHIPIVQAGVGTDQIGRFDMVIDTDSHELKSCTWQCLPIQADTCPSDPVIADILQFYKEKTDAKYGHIVTSFARTLTHPARSQETELGDLFADVLQQGSSFDIMLLGSGSIRLKEMGPLVRFQDLKECLPYDDGLYLVTVSGSQLRRMMSHVLREEAFRPDGHTEFYQVSGNLHMVWSRPKQSFESFTFNGHAVADDDLLRIGLQRFHFVNFGEFFQISPEEVSRNAPMRMIATSSFSIVQEALEKSSGFDAAALDRIRILE